MSSGFAPSQQDLLQQQLYAQQYQLQAGHERQMRLKMHYDGLQNQSDKQYRDRGNYEAMNTTYQEYIPPEMYQQGQQQYDNYPIPYAQPVYTNAPSIGNPTTVLGGPHEPEPSVNVPVSGTARRNLGYSCGQSLLSDLLAATGLQSCERWPLLDCNPFLKEMSSMESIPSLTIPSRKSSMVIFEIYNEIVSPLYPVFLKHELQAMLNDVYLNNLIARRDIEQTTSNCYALILAQVIGILSRSQPVLAEMEVQCVRYTRSGLADLFLNPTIGGIRYLLSILLVNHAKELPDPVWFTSGMTMLMCVDLSLHREIEPVSCKTKAGKHIDEEEKRRIFWTAYAIDRGLALAFGRPMSLEEVAITRAYPTTVSDHALGRFKIRRLQSKIMTSHQALDQSVGLFIPFPTVQERDFMTELDQWKQNKEGEEVIQGGNTELLLLRRGVTNKDPRAMIRSMQVITQNLRLYKSEALQMAILEGLLVVHDLTLNLITLLYIHRFGTSFRGPSLGDLRSAIDDMKPILLKLARRWNTSLENLKLVEDIFGKLCASPVQ